MNQATPQETFDHILGSGATTYSWWQSVKPLWDTTGSEGEIPDDWSAELICEDGNDGTKCVVINHELVMDSARELLRMYLSKDPAGRPDTSDTTVCACAMLIFNADDCDFDAGSADCLLQLMVLGEIVFG